MKANCKQAALKSCQEEEEEGVEATIQEYSRRLFLSRGQLWPRAEAQRGREKLTNDGNTHSHTLASTHSWSGVSRVLHMLNTHTYTHAETP